MEMSDHAIRDIRELRCFMTSAFSGFNVTQTATRSLKLEHLLEQVTAKSEGRDHESITLSSDRVEFAEALERFATNQKALGHPYLFGLGVVRLWAILEVFVEEVVRARLSNRVVNPLAEPIANLRIQAGLFLPATSEEQVSMVFEELKRTTKASAKIGVGRFEVLLDAVGLGGGIEDIARRAILGFSKTRNVVVHKSGIADAEFIKSCPWLGAKLNEPLVIGQDHFVLYLRATHWYMLEIICRSISDATVSGREQIERSRQDNLDSISQLLGQVSQA
jgi:hypothetical protein